MAKKLIILILLLFLYAKTTHAKTPEELQAEADGYTTQIAKLEKEKDTLSNQIKILDSQINLAALKINQTENNITSLETDIQKLAVDIGKLDINLNQLTSVFIEQINQNYKMQKQGPPIASILFFDFNNYLSQLRYVTAFQKNSQETIIKLETTRTDFDTQKTQKEIKQTELEDLKNKLSSQKITLDTQKANKKSLLEITNNSESNYQKLLANVRAELAAIEGILAGKGEEIKVGGINAGDRIATVISGSSCNSSGTHLHFMVQKNGTVQNPFNYLKSTDYNNDSGGDPFNPTGSWNWPLNPKIDFNQGYGSTWSIKNTWVKRIYSFHNGIDIGSEDLSVHATHKGTLYRGSMKSGCILKYVRVEDTDTKTETYYLHINYF